MRRSGLLPSEHEIQASYFDWVRMMRLKDWRYELIYAVPNAGKRNATIGNRMVAEGLSKGVLDVNIDMPAGGFNGARIEFKSAKGALTKAQEEYFELYRAAGYYPILCRTFNKAQFFTEHYLSRSTKIYTGKPR